MISNFITIIRKSGFFKGAKISIEVYVAEMLWIMHEKFVTVIPLELHESFVKITYCNKKKKSFEHYHEILSLKLPIDFLCKQHFQNKSK